MSQGNNKPSNSTLKWAAGVLATVISGVAVFWLTEGWRSSEPTQSTLQVDPVEQTDSQQPVAETPVAETPVAAAPQVERELDGIWEITVKGNRKVGSDGFIEEVTGTINRVWRLNFTDNVITGEMLGSKGTALRNPCNDATLDGEINQQDIQLTLTFTGSCCPEEQSLYALNLEPDSDTFRGTMRPKDVPKNGCTLWYGDLIGEKRTE